MAATTPASPAVPTVLGIDPGASSVKAVVINVDGSVVSQARGAYPVSSPHPGWSQTEPKAWLAANDPGSYAATRWAMQPKDWLRAQLTGRFDSEPSDASATLLYNVRADFWDIDVIHALGVDAALLPAILPSSGTEAGKLTAAAARLLGLPAGIPVAAGAADTAAAALGSGLLDANTAQLTIGTGAQATLLARRPVEGRVTARPRRKYERLYIDRYLAFVEKVQALRSPDDLLAGDT